MEIRNIIPVRADGREGLVQDIGPMQQLHRFIVLGAEANTYHVDEADLKRENCKAVEALIARGDGPLVVEELVNFSTQGRVAKEKNILFALAMCSRLGDEKTKKAAYDAVPRICRTFSSLTEYLSYHMSLSPNSKGWGAGLRRAVKTWYVGRKNRTERDIAYQVVKYPQRNGISHKDALLLGHVKPDNDTRNLVFKYAVKGFDAIKDQKLDASEAGILIDAVNKLKATRDPKEAAKLILDYDLVHECVPTEIKNSPEVWEALLNNMPVRALTWNLAKMTSYGLLKPGSASLKKVVAELSNVEQLQNSRLHPFTVLKALNTYRSGKGTMLTWTPVKEVEDVLDNAFYACFKNHIPSGKRVAWCLDVSGSMRTHFMWEGRKDKFGNLVYDQNMSARACTAALALVAAKMEDKAEFFCFSSGNGGFNRFPVNKDAKLSEVMDSMKSIPFGGTDISLPFRWAAKNKEKFDGFVVLTDNETNSNTQSPAQALKDYRKTCGIDAKLVVVAFSSNNITVADKADPGMIDIPGFDSDGPAIISNFLAGRI